METKNKNKLIIYTFFGFFLLVGFITYDDYGISIEEHTQLYSGIYWLNYIVNFFEIDFLKERVLQNLNSFTYYPGLPDPKIYNYYGPIFDVPTAFIDVIFSIQKTSLYFHYRHFLVFLIFYLSSIVFFHLLLKRFNNFFISFFGTALYIFSPRIYGDSFHNNKDIILLSFVVFSIFFAFKTFEKKKIKNILLFSLFAAIATSTRVMGLFLPMSLIIFLYLEKLNNKSISNTKYILLAIFSYFLFLFIHWPYLWESPISNFIEFISKSKDIIFSYYILFNGNYILTNSLPDSFIFTWIGISSPILNLVLFLFGFYFIGKRLFSRFLLVEQARNYKCDFWRSPGEMKDYYIFFNFVSILSILVFLNVPLVSGWRHLYFLNFFMIYIAVYSLKIIAIAFKKYIYRLFLCLLILLAPSIYKIIIFHPYQSLYLNEILNSKNKNNFLIDREGLTQLDSIYKILSLAGDKEKINIANASFIPYYRIKDALSQSNKNRVNFVGTEYNKADYIYDNYVYEVDPKYNKKYNIPPSFKKVYQLKINGIKMYEIYKRK